MMNTWKVWGWHLQFLWSLLLLITPTLSGLAEPPSPDAGQELTLSQTLELALQHNPTLQSSHEDVKAADAQRDLALAAFLPKIDANSAYINTPKPSRAFGILLDQARFTAADFEIMSLNRPPSTENVASSLNLTQPIFNGGQVGLGYDMAEAGWLASTEGLEDTHKRSLFHVTQAYYTLASAKSNRIITEEPVHIAQANTKHIANRFQDGLGVKSDLLQAEVWLATQQEEKIRVQQTVEVSRIALQHAIVVDYPVEVADSLTQGNTHLLTPRRQSTPLRNSALIIEKPTPSCSGRRWPSKLLNRSIGQTSTFRPIMN